MYKAVDYMAVMGYGYFYNIEERKRFYSGNWRLINMSLPVSENKATSCFFKELPLCGKWQAALALGPCLLRNLGRRQPGRAGKGLATFVLSKPTYSFVRCSRALELVSRDLERTVKIAVFVWQ